jgi:hypothetical protein
MSEVSKRFAQADEGIDREAAGTIMVPTMKSLSLLFLCAMLASCATDQPPGNEPVPMGTGRVETATKAENSF